MINLALDVEELTVKRLISAIEEEGFQCMETTVGGSGVQLKLS